MTSDGDPSCRSAVRRPYPCVPQPRLGPGCQADASRPSNFRSRRNCGQSLQARHLPHGEVPHALAPKRQHVLSARHAMIAGFQRLGRLVKTASGMVGVSSRAVMLPVAGNFSRLVGARKSQIASRTVSQGFSLGFLPVASRRLSACFSESDAWSKHIETIGSAMAFGGSVSRRGNDADLIRHACSKACRPRRVARPLSSSTP